MSDPRPLPGLRRRVDLALLTAGVLLLVTVVSAALALQTARERQREVLVVYYEAITQTDTTYIQLLDAETAVRGFLLTGDPVTLEPLERILAAPEPEIDVGELLVENFGADHEIVTTRDAGGAAAQAWYFDWAEPSIERVRTEGTDWVTAAHVEEGRVLFEEVRTPVERHTTLLKEGRLDAVQQLRTSTSTLVAAVAALAVLLVVGGTMLWFFLRRWITDPLDSLVDDVRLVADGELGHPVRPVGTGEVREVSTVVEDMRTQLVRVIEEADAAKVALEDTTERLREQAEDLSRSNRDLEQFAYVASHDLQEPLRKVASFTQLLAKRYEGQLDERADQYINYAVDGAKRMQRLINDLLGFSRVGRIGGEVAPVDMGAALEEAVGDLEETIAAAGATVTGVDLPTLPGERPLLVQLLANLVGNAIKFRHPDRAPEVWVEARRDGDRWEMSCRDNGIGIDPQYAERVFVIFQRLHAKEVYEGTGIGLALCKKIVEYHGGDIWIDKDTSQGTTVRWTLPAAPDEAEAGDAGQDGDRTGTEQVAPDETIDTAPGGPGGRA